MARRFDGVDDCITLGLGGSQAMTGFVIAAIVNPSADNALNKTILFAGAANSGTRFGLMTEPGERPTLHVNGTGRFCTSQVNAADDWTLIVINKAQFSASIGRAHIYDFVSKTWAHEDLSGTNVDTSGAVSGGHIIGASYTSAPTSFWVGDIEICGIWEQATALNDAAVEALNLHVDPAYWALPSNPRGYWWLNQPSTADSVVDLSGLGANQTSIVGTSVVPGPPEWGYNRAAFFMAS